MYDDGNIYVDRQVLAVKVGYYCSIDVGLRDSEGCNVVLHQIATSKQMATDTMIMILMRRRLQRFIQDTIFKNVNGHVHYSLP